MLDRERAERQDVIGGVQHDVGELAEADLGQAGHDVAELRPRRVTVGLLEDRAHEGGDHRPVTLRHPTSQVGHEVGSAPLPGGLRQHRDDRRFDAAVGVGDDQLHAGQAAGHQRAQEPRPGGRGLGGDDVEPDDLSTALDVDRGSDHRGDVDDTAAFAHLLRQRVDPHVAVGARLERALPELGHLVIQRGGQPGHLRR